MSNTKIIRQFSDYCLQFYGPAGIYAHFFKKRVTRKALEAAIKLRMATGDFAGDSFDREAVREILLAAEPGGAQMIHYKF